MSRRHTKRRRLLAYLLATALLVAYVTLALLQPLTRVQPTSNFHVVQKPQPISLSWPSFGEGAVGAVGYGVLATHGTQTAIPTASVIKVLTALAVLQEKPLGAHEAGPMITITDADVASYNQQLVLDGSVVAVTAGEQLSERQALEALLLPSANNMADTLARWAFGSVDQYLTYANKYAQTLGMKDTKVTDPSGLDSGTISTPSDLVKLGEAALGNPALAAIVREPSATIPIQGTIYNYNALLGLRGVVGIKTGNSDADPGCFLLAAERSINNQTITIVAVLMDAPNLDDALYQTLPLLYSATQSFASLTVANTDQPFATYAVPWDKPVHAVAKTDVRYAAWQGSTTTITTSLKSLTGATDSRQTVGTLIIRDSLLKQTTVVPLYLDQPVPVPSIFWRLMHPW